MIDEGVLKRIRGMLRRGRSHKRISRKVGVSRSVVRAIAKGTWAAKFRKIRAVKKRLGGSRTVYEQWARANHPNEEMRDEAEIAEVLPDPIRCSGCGGLVYPPCQLCHARNAVRRKMAMSNSTADA